MSVARTIPSVSLNSLPLNLLLAGALAFLSIGVLQAMYGPTFPFFQARYHVALKDIGLIASLHFLGGIITPLIISWLLPHYPIRRLVNTSLLVLMTGMALVIFASSWAMALLGALLGGFGVGGVSATLNTAFASLGTRAVNLVNAIFGVGSSLAPLLVAGLAIYNLAYPFLVVVGLVVITLLAGWRLGFPEVKEQPATKGVTKLGLPTFLFVAVFMLYVCIEVGFGSWSGKHLSSLGLSADKIALTVSGFWVSLTLGRVFAAAFGARFVPQQLVLGSAILTLIAALLATQPILAVAGYLLAGLTLGPIFGTALVWTTQVLPVQVIPFMLLAGSVGGFIIPSLLGRIAGHFGAIGIPVALASCTALLIFFITLTLQMTSSQKLRKL